MVYARKASEGGGAVRLTNMIRGGSVVFGGLEPDVKNWLTNAAKAAILAAFGQTDGKAVIKATNRYLNGIAASDPTKAQALAAFINEDPMMVCSLGLSVEGVTMPIRWLCNAREGDYAYCLTDEIINTATDTLKYRVRTYSRSSNWQVMTPYYRENVLTLKKYGNPTELSVSYGAGTWANVMQGVNTEQGLIVEFRAGTGPYINGSFIPNRYGAFTTPGTYVLGGANTNNTSKSGAPIDLGDVFEHYRNGVLIHQFAPIVCTTKNGMIDLVNMEFHPNQGTGHFTDAYTLQDGVTPWTPLNQQ